MNGLGGPPNFIQLPNGEYGGYELDTLHTLAKHVKAKIKFQKINFWFDYKRDENGKIVLDENGAPIMKGTNAEIYYQRATFAVAHHMYGLLSDLTENLIHSTQTFYYRTQKPRVLAPKWNLIKPFSPTVWICFVCCLFLIMLFYTIFVRVYSNVHDEEENKTWLDNMMAIYKHLLSQSTN